MGYSLNLPLELQAFVDAQAIQHAQGDAARYLTELVRREMTSQQISKELDIGLDSGPPIEMTNEDWAEVRTAGRARAR